MKKKALPQPTLLTVDEVATLLNVAPQTVRRFRRDGVLPVVKLGGKSKSRIRFRECDVLALIESGYQHATSGPLAVS